MRFAFRERSPKNRSSVKTLQSTCQFERANSSWRRSSNGRCRSTSWSGASHRRIGITKSRAAVRLATKSGRREYVPERGDLVWLTFDPQAGHEQAGRRPALVLSPASYNRRAGLALFVPLTRQVKGYPFEVLIPAGLEVAGAVLADQLKSLDWRARQATRFGSLPPGVTREVLQKTSLLVSPAG